MHNVTWRDNVTRMFGNCHIYVILYQTVCHTLNLTILHYINGIHYGDIFDVRACVGACVLFT